MALVAGSYPEPVNLELKAPSNISQELSAGSQLRAKPPRSSTECSPTRIFPFTEISYVDDLTIFDVDALWKTVAIRRILLRLMRRDEFR